MFRNNFSFRASILVFIISLLFSQFSGFFVKPVFAAQTHDLSTSTNYNIRIDGAAAGDILPRSIIVEDIDNNGKNDILVGASKTDNNSRIDSGSLYIIYDFLLDDYSGVGNNIDLANPSNYNLRFDGAAAGDDLSNGGSFIADFDSDGKKDIFVGAQLADNNSRDKSGSTYIIYNTLIDDYGGTGNNIDLANSANYNLRFDGSAANETSGDYLNVADLDSDGKTDVILGASAADKNSRTNSGSIYLIYNTLFSGYSGTGNNIDLSTSSNYNLRFDGAVAGDRIPDAYAGTADLDGDNKQDLIIGAANGSRYSRTSSGAIYVIKNTLLDDYGGTGNNVNLLLSTNYNLQYYGAASESLGVPSQVLSDLNGDGKTDLVLGAMNADYNSRTNSGSVYIIFNALIDDYGGTGNNIDLTNSSNFNIRYDGAAVSDKLSYHSLSVLDLDSDGKQDILMGAYGASNNGRAVSGSLYVIYNTFLDDYFSSIDTTVDLAINSNYSLRYDGATASDYLTFIWLPIGKDLNNDGAADILIPAYGADNNSRTTSGSLYIIYNFPHSWNLDSVEEYSRNTRPKITGNILAPNSVLNPYLVQFQVDASAFYGSWSECPADDGSYDTKDVAEKFTCQLTNALTEGAHKVYIRASDANGSYSARYKVAFLNTDLTGPMVTLTQVDSKPFKENISLTNSTPTFFGKITDSLSQSLAAGPREVKVELKKKDSKANYQTQETKTLVLTQNYWEDGQAKITDNTLNTSNKYSTFSYTPSQKLTPGSYQLILTGKDKADNQGSPKTYTFTVSQGGSAASEITAEPAQSEEAPPSQPQPTPIPEPQISTKPLSFFQKILNFLKNLWPF